MVITSLQEKQNRKFYVPIRPGNRGGWSLFNWDEVREKPYRDRQMYLGNSAVIGVLDKGGKWRKRDWYLKTDKKYKNPQLTSQQQQAMKRDMERMNNALGDNDVQQDDQALTEQEMQQLLKRIKNKDDQDPEQFKDAKGLGFDKTKVQIRAKPTIAKGVGANRLQGYDEIQIDKEDQIKSIKKQKKQKKQVKQDVESQRSRSARKQKKSKKEKKEKKQKKHKKQKRRLESSERSRSSEKNTNQRSRHKKQKRRQYSSSQDRRQRRHQKHNHEKRRD